MERRIQLTKNLYLDEYIPKELYVRFEKAPNRLIWMLDERLVKLDQRLRDIFGPVTINNWFIGGARNCSGLRLRASYCKEHTVFSQHCVDDKTEILTNKGWRFVYDPVDYDKVVTLNPDTFDIEEKPINKRNVYTYIGTMYGIKTKHIDSLVTYNHRHFVASRKEKHLFDFHYAENIHNKRRFFIRSGNRVDKEFSLTALEKLAIATVADGVLKDNNIHFHLSKQRKIDKILSIGKELGVEFNIYKDKLKKDTYYITVPSKIAKQVIDIVGRPKSLMFARGLKHKAESVIKEYMFYDGHIDERDNVTYSSISSISKITIDVLSELAVYAGIPHTIMVSNRVGSFFSKNKLYIIGFTSRDKNITRVTKHRYYTIDDYKGIVWSLDNDNTTMVVRRNGKVYITGNSFGRASDKIFKFVTAEEVIDYIRGHQSEFIEMGLHGIEVGVSWVHTDVRNGFVKDDFVIFTNKSRK